MIAPAAQRELEKISVERQSPVQIIDFQNHVVDA
jgi:hypothetical protein